MSKPFESCSGECSGRAYFEAWHLDGPKFTGPPSVPEAVTPPLRVAWKQTAPGQIGGLGVTNGRLLAAYGKAGWCVLDTEGGKVLHDLAAGPAHDGMPGGVLLPDGKFALVKEQMHDWAVIDFEARKSRRAKLYPRLFHGDALVVKEDRSGAHSILEAGKLRPFPRHLAPLAKHLALYRGLSYWLSLEEAISGTSHATRTLQAVDPNSGKTIWRRRYASEHGYVMPKFKWIGVYLPVGDTDENWLEVLNQSDGSVVWKFPGLRDTPAGTRGGYFSILHWEKPLGLVLLQTGQVWRTFCVDFAKNKVLWTLPEAAGARFCTGDILWCGEPPAKAGAVKRSNERDLVARNILDGAELWRMSEMDRALPWRGRLYSWRGKTLTCWESAQGTTDLTKPKSGASEAKTGRAAKKSSAVVLKTRHGAMTAPEPEEDWREWFCSARSMAAGQRLSVKALAKALRVKFKGATVLPDGTIELCDHNECFWGRITFDRKPPSKVKRKTDMDDKVSAFRLYADLVVCEIVDGFLRKSKLNWDVSE